MTDYSKELDEILTAYGYGVDSQGYAEGYDEAKAKLAALLRRVEVEAKLEQTVHLQVAEQKFGKVDWKAAIYGLEPRDKWGSE